MKYAVRAGTAISMLGLLLSFLLAWILDDPLPFVSVAPIAVGGKWLENWQERRHPKKDEPEIKAVP